MKNIVLNIGIIIFTSMIVVGILYFFNGSLEMVPTEEQIEKARICSVMLIIIGVISDVILIMLKHREK